MFFSFRPLRLAIIRISFHPSLFSATSFQSSFPRSTPAKIENSILTLPCQQALLLVCLVACCLFPSVFFRWPQTMLLAIYLSRVQWNFERVSRGLLEFNRAELPTVEHNTETFIPLNCILCRISTYR